jgi:hypothetical protein
MKPNLSKLQSAERQSNEQRQENQAQTTREFASPEEMLRFDAAQVTPPPSLIDRLKNSLAQDPSAQRSWWRRWLRLD